MELVKEDFDVLREFLSRVDLKGREVNVFVALLNKLAMVEAAQKEPKVE